MKRIETSRIRKGQARGETHIEAAAGVHDTGLTSKDEWRSTWDQEIWPDCLD